jgi:protein TonB
MESQHPPNRQARGLTVALVALGVVGVAVLLVVLVRSFFDAKPTQSRPVAQVIQLVRPPPPPPDQPPPPPPPPEKVEEVMPQDAPDPTPSPDMAPEQLGLDAEGAAGGDAFGLAARRGGTDLLGTGSASRNRAVNLVKRTLQDRFNENDEFRRGGYSIDVSVWVDEEGLVTKLVISKGTGKPALDAAIIQQALSRPLRIGEARPSELGMSINLRVSPRG